MRYRAIVLMGLLLAGCGGGKPATNQSQLTMWLVGSEAQAQTINAIAKEYAQQHGVEVRCEAIAWGEAHSKYLTAVAGGVQPDIGTMGLTWGGEFGRLGALMDLKQAFPQDVDAVRQKAVPGLWDSIATDGQVFGIPFDLTLQVLYYRTDLVPKAPQTWDELVQLLGALAKDNRRMIFDWGSLSWIGYAPFLWQAGGDFYTPDGRAGSLHTPEALAALQFFRDLYTRHGVPRTSIPIEQGLRTGDFPLAISGNWKIISLMTGVPEIEGKWTVAQLPAGPSGKRTAFLGGRIMTIFTNSKHQAKAWKFILHLFEPSVQVKLYQAGIQTQDAYLPPNMATWDQLPMDEKFKSVLKQQSQDAKGPPPVSGWTETTHLVESAIQRTILHQADPKAELGQASEAMTKALTASSGH